MDSAWVTTEQFPDAETIENDVKGIVDYKFPMLTLTGENGFWHLGLLDNAHLTIHFWRENDQTLQFTHRNTHPFCWWVEYEVRNALALKYKGMVRYDEVVREPERPQPTSYGNFRQYLEGVFTGLNDLISDAYSADLPAELMPLKG
tara:strand:+ start:170 stop:607 length:438 start_codon:yes stop_codon:yes gene_type:complete